MLISSVFKTGTSYEPPSTPEPQISISRCVSFPCSISQISGWDGRNPHIVTIAYSQYDLLRCFRSFFASPFFAQPKSSPRLLHRPGFTSHVSFARRWFGVSDCEIYLSYKLSSGIQPSFTLFESLAEASDTDHPQTCVQTSSFVAQIGRWQSQG